MRSLHPSVFALLVFPLLLTGCQKLFTTSLAEGLARDSYTISADISNEDAAALLADSELSPAALTSLLSVLNDQAAAGDSGAAALAAEAAVGASGVSGTVTAAITAALNTGTVDTATLVLALVSGANSEVVAGLSGLSDPSVLAAADLSPTELVVAAALLAASALPPGVTDPTTLSGTNPGDPLYEYQHNPDVVLAASLITTAGTDLSGSGIDPALAQQLADLLNTGA
jgi:hypothetical protein